jgi:P4 family phage/plasmid primase-like protien
MAAISIPKFASALQSQGIIYYTKKTATSTILDIGMFKRMACAMKEPNNKLVNNADTLVIFTGTTKNINKYLVMIDFDKLDNPVNKDFYEYFTKYLDEHQIDTYFEKTMRDGYHYFFITDTLFSSTTKLELNNMNYDIDIRGYGGKSLSYGTKYDKLKVIPGNSNACKTFTFAQLPNELIEMLKLNKYNEERSKQRDKDFSNPRKTIISTTINNSSQNDEYNKILKLTTINTTTNLDTNLDTNLKKAQYILQSLSIANIKYYSSYEEWRNIGFALGTMANEEPNMELEFLQLYLSFSAQYKYWNLECYQMAYNIFYSSNNTITIGTLIYKLKQHQDLYSKYKELSTISHFDYMVEYATHGAFAKYYHSQVPDKYIYDEATNKWYILLDTNIWEPLREYSRKIRIDIKNVILPIVMNKLNNELNTTKDSKLIKNYNKIINKLDTEDFMKNTYNALKDCYLKNNIKFDTAIHLFAFKNGICFDFSNNTKTIRNILPTDYISITTGYDYIEPSNNDIEYVNKFIYSLFENTTEVEFITKSISNVLYGRNKYQKCFFFLGIGANGKTVLLTLMENTFGNYSIKASSTLFTKPEKDALISPEIVQCKGKRLLHISEPNPNEKIQQSRYKSTTGNEKISARSLFSNEIETYTPNFTPFISCNQVPLFELIDDAIKRRSILIYFKYRFIANPEFTNDKTIDNDLQDKLSTENMLCAFARILYNNYTHNYDPAKYLPPSSKYILNEFISANDQLYDFLNSDNIIADRNNNNIRISISVLYDIYKDYHDKMYHNDPSCKAMGLRKFTEAIVNKGFRKVRVNNTFIIGIKNNLKLPNSNNNQDSDNNQDNPDTFEIDMD